ncbi:hypothetical protein FHS34_001481 [Streptomyces echinatus]|uniref:Uncharacterized protein n=1 Tax=Streptomyces echinatus TaxID=67293 RepID=A0A7W9UP68_9ACTN|nr:hypothetical protein [Streptomyces echinatus]
MVRGLHDGRQAVPVRRCGERWAGRATPETGECCGEVADQGSHGDSSRTERQFSTVGSVL